MFVICPTELPAAEPEAPATPSERPTAPRRTACRLMAATISLFATAALVGAAPALADSVAYVDGGDVYLMTPDGTRQFQVTSTGGYTTVAQADDGTLLATTALTSHLRRLDRTGNVLSDIATPVSDHSGGVITFQGPFDADVSPNGKTVSYGCIESGLFVDPTTGILSAQTKNGAGFTRSDALTGFTDDGDKHSNAWDAPEFVGDSDVLLSNGPLDLYDDNIAVEKVGTGNPVNWFSDGAVPHPMEASISRNKQIIATVNGPERKQLLIYRDTDEKLGSTPGQALNVQSGFTYSGSGMASPTFSADGTRGFWSTTDGVQAASFSMASSCGTAQNSRTIAPGGTSPDWGPADVPAARPAPAPAPAPTPSAGSPTAPSTTPTRSPAPAVARTPVTTTTPSSTATPATFTINGITPDEVRQVSDSDRIVVRNPRPRVEWSVLLIGPTHGGWVLTIVLNPDRLDDAAWHVRTAWPASEAQIQRFQRDR